MSISMRIVSTQGTTEMYETSHYHIIMAWCHDDHGADWTEHCHAINQLSLRPLYRCRVLWWVCLWVCLSVCLSVGECISETTRLNYTKFSAQVSSSGNRGSVLRWLRGDTINQSITHSLSREFYSNPTNENRLSTSGFPNVKFKLGGHQLAGEHGL